AHEACAAALHHRIQLLGGQQIVRSVGAPKSIPSARELFEPSVEAVRHERLMRPARALVQRALPQTHRLFRRLHVVFDVPGHLTGDVEREVEPAAYTAVFAMLSVTALSALHSGHVGCHGWLSRDAQGVWIGAL